MHRGLCLYTESCKVSLCHLVATICSGAIPCSTHAMSARRTSCLASLKPGTLWTLVDSVPAWFAPAKYHGALTSVGVPEQCLYSISDSLESHRVGLKPTASPEQGRTCRSCRDQRPSVKESSVHACRSKYSSQLRSTRRLVHGTGATFLLSTGMAEGRSHLL